MTDVVRGCHPTGRPARAYVRRQRVAGNLIKLRLNAAGKQGCVRTTDGICQLHAVETGPRPGGIFGLAMNVKSSAAAPFVYCIILLGHIAIPKTGKIKKER